jgi:hypothetical protein
MNAAPAERILTDAEAAQFQRSRRVRRVLRVVILLALVLFGATVGPPLFRHLSAMSSFQLLGASVDWRFDDETWRRGGVTSIAFDGGYGYVGDDVIKRLKYLHNLESVDLADCDTFTDAGLFVLKELPSLKELDLSRTRPRRHLFDDSPPPKLTDTVLVPIQGLTGLTSLSLAGNLITDDGLARLSGLTNLTYLDLSDTKVTDKGLKHLKGLKRLKTLLLTGTKVTKEGAMEIDQAIPGVTISFADELKGEGPPTKPQYP